MIVAYQKKLCLYQAGVKQQPVHENSLVVIASLTSIIVLSPTISETIKSYSDLRFYTIRLLLIDF
jgi:hypothetical protein